MYPNLCLKVLKRRTVFFVASWNLFYCKRRIGLYGRHGLLKKFVLCTQQPFNMNIQFNNHPDDLIKQHSYTFILYLVAACLAAFSAAAQKADKSVRLIAVANGWANNSVNAVVFRKNALVTYRDTQYISFYDADRFVVLGKRSLGSVQWELKRTPYQGNAADAHNTSSKMIDGAGYLHLAWDHHNNALHYARSRFPGSLELSERLPMTGLHEDQVAYPEFYKLPDGNLLFLYRDGGSGRGNLVINRWDVASKTWTGLHNNLIDGEGKRNAYRQAHIDGKGTVHISWVWRESPDVASNHDLCYARSTDGGVTWQKSTGENDTVPINAATAEYALRISQNRELINQTSMCADAAGNPFIATYWRDASDSVPQYRIVYAMDKNWKLLSLPFRKTPFSLSGVGSKQIPISRPQVLVSGAGKGASVRLLFRDEERGSKVSAVTINTLASGTWRIEDLTERSVGWWEPSYDTELWKERGLLHLFVQKVEQVDAEGKADVPPQLVQVLEWKWSKNEMRINSK
jgi:hypothetical protein